MAILYLSSTKRNFFSLNIVIQERGGLVAKCIISSLVVLGCLILVAGGVLRAQSIYGTITGTVYDPSGAVVANANVILKNVASGDVRKGATNSDGYYSFSSVPTGAYTLTVEAAGFQKTVTEGIAVTGAASLSFPIKLAIGAATTEVKVEGVADQIIPTDSGEKSVRSEERSVGKECRSGESRGV